MKHRYLKDVTTLKYNANKCTGCERCTEVCPHGVFGFDDNNAYIADKNSCIECGACAMNCPAGAIGVDPGAGCAVAILYGWLTGEEPSCDCGSGCC